MGNDEDTTLNNLVWVDKEKFKTSFNVGPTYYQPVLCATLPDKTEKVPTLQIHVMKWGLVPFYAAKQNSNGKRIIINARDDSIKTAKPAFRRLRDHKRCVVLAQGYYEWQIKGKDRLPFFVKRHDGQMMCIAALYDCIRLNNEPPTYNYCVITTGARNDIAFIHDRMPVILENSSDKLFDWLDPRVSWSNDMAKLLTPYAGNLDYYPVTHQVNKVGNSSANYIIPIDSPKNKTNIANFFRQTPSPSKTFDRIKIESPQTSVPFKTEITKKNDTGICKDEQNVTPVKRNLPTNSFESKKVKQEPLHN